MERVGGREREGEDDGEERRRKEIFFEWVEQS